jgi:DNA-binding MarR family transcriptional regulator
MAQPEQAIADVTTEEDPARLERLKHVARLYGDAVGIIDALRIQGWSEGGLTIAQLRLLMALRDEDGLPVGSLAELLGVNPSTITGHVDRLVKQDLVRREEDAIDRRIVRNYLTDDGRAVVTAVLHVAGQYIVNILRRLDDADLDALDAALVSLNRAAADARRESR